MHGNKANVVLFKKETVQELFKNSLKRDLTIVIDKLDRDIDWSYDTFLAHHHELPKVYFTWGKVVWQYLDQSGFQNKPVEEKWKLVQHILSVLNKGEFYIIENNGLPQITLLPVNTIIHTSKDPINILNVFTSLYNTTFAFEKEKRETLTFLNTKISHTKNYLTKTSEKLKEIQNHTHYKIWADLVMANLQNITPGITSVKLINFYSGAEEEIKLKADLSPQKNAALFYKKAKNQAIEIEFLEQSLKSKSDELQRLTETVIQVENTTEVKSLRALIKDQNINKTLKEEIQDNPFHEFEHKGFRILVGKNAVNNDLLTLKHAYKEDLWLHAKDVAGSHVVIKYQSGKKFPKDVIERAAQLAAFNSKRKTESLCPVIFTPKKYVRKRKGDPAGAMVVEKEEVIMVEPKL